MFVVWAAACSKKNAAGVNGDAQVTYKLYIYIYMYIYIYVRTYMYTYIYIYV